MVGKVGGVDVQTVVKTWHESGEFGVSMSSTGKASHEREELFIVLQESCLITILGSADPTVRLQAP